MKPEVEFILRAATVFEFIGHLRGIPAVFGSMLGDDVGAELESPRGGGPMFIGIHDIYITLEKFYEPLRDAVFKQASAFLHWVAHPYPTLILNKRVWGQIKTALNGQLLPEYVRSLILDAEKAPSCTAAQLRRMNKRLTKGLRFLDHIAYRLDRYQIPPQIPTRDLNNWSVVFKYLHACYRFMFFQETNSAAKWQPERHSRLGSPYWVRILEARAQTGNVLAVAGVIAPAGALNLSHTRIIGW